MSEAIEAYPLTWPPHRPRCSWREHAPFRVTLGRAINDVQYEVTRLGGSDLILSSNLPLRRDGLPMANRQAPVDPGVAVYFAYKKRPMCFACDRWNAIQDNMRGIAKTIEALRGIARWGTGDMIEQAFAGFAALPSLESWWQVLEFRAPPTTRDEIERAHRRLIMAHHPDRTGGDNEKAARINRARDQGLDTCEGR